ncbi:MAG TPA: hypothetical protein VF326_02670 [Anaerolineaceae bacterium]|jgi:hypothetical protein
MSPAVRPEKNPKKPSEVRFIDIHVEPWPDSNKVRVHVELTPFAESPNLEVSILDPAGNEISTVSIIESAVRKLVFTMHLRGMAQTGPFTLMAKIVYPSIEPVDQTQISFTLPAQA